MVEVGQITPYDVAENNELSDIINYGFSRLSSREKLIIEMRYGVNKSPSFSYAIIAELMGVCRMRVRQIEQNALKKLKKYFTHNKQWGYVK